jgi:hypothetical protein
MRRDATEIVAGSDLAEERDEGARDGDVAEAKHGERIPGTGVARDGGDGAWVREQG